MLPLIQARASLVAQMVKNLPAMRETCVRSLGWEDPLEKGTATKKVWAHLLRHHYGASISAWKEGGDVSLLLVLTN